MQCKKRLHGGFVCLIQYYCYSDYCPILMMGHFHQAAACTNRLTGYNVFLTTNFWNAKLAK